MDAVLINPYPGGKGLNEVTVEPPLGLAYIAAVLRKNNFNCKIIDANVLRLRSEEVVSGIPEAAKIIGIYLNSFSYNSVKTLIGAIRAKRRKSLIVLGGPLPSTAPEMALEDLKPDGVIRGEGEYSLLKVAENLRANRFHFDGEISGLAYFDSQNRLKLNTVVRISDLDNLPFPAYDLLPPPKYYRTRARHNPVAAIITSRGCPFDCSFCSRSVFPGKATLRSAGSVLSEIDYLAMGLKARQIDILDDNFAQSKQRMNEILDGLISRNYGLALNFQSGIRTENLDEEILLKFKKAGVYKLAFGIESADEEVLKAHGKKLDLQRAERIIRLAGKMGFIVYGFFIIGLPGETEEAFNKTVKFARRADFDVANFCIAIPFFGTRLYRMVKEKGRFLIDTDKNIDSGFYGGSVFFEYGECGKKDVIRRFRKAYKAFYSFRKKLAIISKIRSFSEFIWLFNAMRFVKRYSVS